MKQKRLLKWFGVFFAVMLLFTFLSRAMDSFRVAQVAVSSPKNQMISHKVSGNGKIEGTEERAIFVPEGLKIEQSYVESGETIKKEQLLFAISEGSIQDNIQIKQDEIRELSMKISDIQSQKELEALKNQNRSKRVQEDLDAAVDNGDINISNAQNEVYIAQQRLNEFRYRRAAEESAYAAQQQDRGLDFTDGSECDISDGSSGSLAQLQQENDLQEQALMDQVRAKTELLNQVIMNRNREVKEADRAKQDAALPEVQDSTEEMLQLQKERKEQELQELEILLESKGRILSPVDGVIKNIPVKTGSLTFQEAAAVLYEFTGELSMTGKVTKEDLEYVSPGASVRIEGVRKTTVEDAVVRAVQEDSTEPGTFLLKVSVPQGKLAIGENVEFTVEHEKGPYNCCVPLSAVYGPEGQEYVFVTDTKDTVLGEIQVARKVSVQIKERNHMSVALSEGALASTQKVIISADREIEEGSRVRLQEE